MKHSLGIALLLMLALFQCLTTVAQGEPHNYPHMRAAIDHLEAAKTAKNPVASLKAARAQLNKAKANKEGERKDAIAYVNEAIAYATTGDRGKMQEKITKAIGNAKSGIARAR